MKVYAPPAKRLLRYIVQDIPRNENGPRRWSGKHPTLRTSTSDLKLNVQELVGLDR